MGGDGQRFPGRPAAPEIIRTPDARYKAGFLPSSKAAFPRRTDMAYNMG